MPSRSGAAGAADMDDSLLMNAGGPEHTRPAARRASASTRDCGASIPGDGDLLDPAGRPAPHAPGEVLTAALHDEARRVGVVADQPDRRPRYAETDLASG